VQQGEQQQMGTEPTAMATVGVHMGDAVLMLLLLLCTAATLDQLLAVHVWPFHTIKH
jgi:hypothetical protein